MNNQIQLFKKLNNTVIIFVIGYIAIYSVLECKAVVAVLVGTLLTAIPLIYYFESRNKPVIARFIFLISCSLYVYSAPAGIRVDIGAEYYYLACVIVPLILFDHVNSKYVAFSSLIPLVAWLVTSAKLLPPFPESWLLKEFPAEPFRYLNFLGAFLIMGLMLRYYVTYLRTVNTEQVASIEAARLESQKIAKELQVLFDSLSVGVLKQDHLHRINHFNKSACEILGQSAESLLGMTPMNPVFRGVRPDMSDFPDEERAAVLALKTGIPQRNKIIGVRSPSGDLKWISVSATPLFSNLNEENREVIVTLNDITELHIAQKTLELTFGELNQFFNISIDLLCIFDFNGMFKKINPAFETILGYSNSEMYAKPMIEFVCPEDRNKVVLEIEKVIAGGKIENFVCRFICKNGGVRVLSWTAAPQIKDQQIYGAARDMTELVRAEEEAKKERAKSLQSSKLASLGEMSAGIAHEINNPIAIIAGAAALLPIVADDQEKVVAKAELIRKASERISKIVNGLRKFARASERAEHKKHSLRNLVKEAVILVEAKAKRSSTRIDLSCVVDGNILCDEIEMQQVLVNLINNGIDAVKKLDEKWVSIKIFERDNEVILQVLDSGRGISPEVSQKLFQPFFTTKVVGEGTGLGLSIAKGILDEHRATIELLDKYPNTCFEIRFRKAEVSQSAA